MICTRCGSKIGVLNTIKNTGVNEVYRLRKCRGCGYTFYTLEYEIKLNAQLAEQLRELDRKNSYAKPIK